MNSMLRPMNTNAQIVCGHERSKAASPKSSVRDT